MGEFPEQHLFVLQDKWHREVNIKPPGADEGKQAKGAPASGAQSGNHDIGVNDNVWNWHKVMVERTT